nr:integrase, catalytic region, zinc finger, CCHC-type, peptidase aspartic, catalytic [Tanacetum cinerariifolium]
VFGALCYPKNDREDIGKLGAKGDIGFVIGYSADSCAYRIYNCRTKKIMETMNVSFDEISAIAFEQRSLKPGLQTTVENVPPAQVRQTSTTSTTIADNVPIPTNSSSLVTNIPSSLQDVDELNPNAMIDGNMFVNNFATSSSNAADTSSSQNVDPSNMHTFYQPYPHEFQWTMDHPLEQVIGEPSRPVLTRNQLRSDDDMCMYALTVKEYQEKDKIRSKTDKNEKRGEAGKSQEQLHSHYPIPSGQFLSQDDFKHITLVLVSQPGIPITSQDVDELNPNAMVDGNTFNFGFELTGFSDADYAGCKDSFKSTSGGAQFLGEKLVSWSSKKQDCTAMSTAEAEYMSLSACCAQVL